MIKKLLSNKRTLKLQGLFFLIAIGYALCYLFSSHFNSGDFFFNYVRLKESGLDLMHGQLPQFSWYTGTVLGSAVNTYYPWLLMLPFAVLLSFGSPIIVWGAMVSVGMLIGLEIAYYPMRSLKKSPRYALLFALLYDLSTIPFSEIYGQGDVGCFYAMLIAPIAFCAWVHWQKSGKWKMLASSMLLLVFAHIATTIVVTLALAVLTLLNIKSVNFAKIKNGLKAVLVFILGSAVIWLPILVLNHSNQVFLPSQVPLNATQQPFFFRKIMAWFVPSVNNIWDIVDLIGAVLAIAKWNRLKRWDKQLVGISAFIYFINLYYVNRWLVHHTILSTLQFTHRFAFLSQIFMTVVLLDIIFNILVYQWSRKSLKRLIKYLLIFVSLTVVTGEVEEVIVTSTSKDYSYFRISRYRNDRQSKYGFTTPEMDSQQTLHSLSVIYPDYYPKAWAYYSNHLRDEVIKARPRLSEYTSANALRVKAKRDGWRSLPVALYHGQTYSVHNNGQKAIFRNYNHQLRVRLHKGMNYVQVQAPIMWYRYLAILISLSGGLTLYFANTEKTAYQYGTRFPRFYLFISVLNRID